MSKNTSRQEILMCPPTYFAVEYKINPWMVTQVDREKAQIQWIRLKKTFDKQWLYLIIGP